jgi:GT2 family glycosyltransferase
VDISVLIINWNAASDTIRCIQQVRDWQSLTAELWIVDNASAERDKDKIVSAFPGIRMFCNSENLGFSGAVNIGLRAILEEFEHPILLLNNDAVIDEDSLKRLISTLTENERIGLVGPLLYSAGSEPQLIAAGSRNPVLHHHSSAQTIPVGRAVFDVDYISGSVALLRSAVLRKTGLLDEDYFFYTEVADLCHRARQQGYNTVVDTRAMAYHDLDRSASLRDHLYVYYIIRNRFVYIRKRYSLFALPLTIFWAFYSLLLAIKLGLIRRRQSSRAVILGLLDGLIGRFGGQNERVLAFCGVDETIA